MDRTRAFTLIDMFLTMAVLVVLAAIVVPNYSDVSDGARETTVLAQLSTIRKQTELYNAEHPDDHFNPVLKKKNNNKNKGPKGNAKRSPWWALVDGDYLSGEPRNPLQNNSASVAAAPAAGVGWVFADPKGLDDPMMYAVDSHGNYLDADRDGVPD